MDVPDAARKHIESDQVAWLTTVSDSGAPTPNPVWFIPDGDDLVVFSEPSSRKVRNIEQRPVVALHFNSDPDGHDIVIVRGTATLRQGRASEQPGYVDKYADGIRDLGLSVEVLDTTYSTRIAITPSKIRLTPGEG